MPCVACYTWIVEGTAKTGKRECLGREMGSCQISSWKKSELTGETPLKDARDDLEEKHEGDVTLVRPGSCLMAWLEGIGLGSLGKRA